MPSYFAGSIRTFIETPSSELRDALNQGYASDNFNFLYTPAIDAWKTSIEILKEVLPQATAADSSLETESLILEFWIPRRMRRVDAILLVRGKIMVLEFKPPDSGSGVSQVEDYALDLRDFHEPSKNRLILPVVVSNRHRRVQFDSSQLIQPTQLSSPDNLANLILNFAQFGSSQTALSPDYWNEGDYWPVPTVLEAARAMFADMKVEEIARADADSENLTVTINALRNVVTTAADNGSKVICFVTGVPGAGKTLAGLRIVHDEEIASRATVAFLSGNGPLVKILQAALAEDQAERRRLNLRTSRRDPEALIQGVYGFKKSLWNKPNKIPVERVIVFDEAQRAWDRRQNVKKLKAPKDYPFSEPALILDIMGRHQGWAVLIALIGGGQEIHEGEAGLAEWGRTLAQFGGKWEVVASPQALEGGEATAGWKLFDGSIPIGSKIRTLSALHLDNPKRQYRGKTVASWVNAVIAGNSPEAQNVIRQNPEYPILVTRDLEAARNWLRERKKGTERIGLVASSAAGRLRPYGIETSNTFHKGIPIQHWFLREADDYRSSYRLEVATTEFEIQGLELDWVGVCWGGDMLRNSTNDEWKLQHLTGPSWRNTKNEIDIRYTLNTYRVLLTRARQGMVIFVPLGDLNDATLPPQDYEITYQFLLQCGVTPLSIS